jgi:hypothetical protein
MNLSTLGLLFVLTLHLQAFRHHSAPVAGLALFPLFLPLTVIAPIAGRLTAHRPARPASTERIAAATTAGVRNPSPIPHKPRPSTTPPARPAARSGSPPSGASPEHRPLMTS